MKMPSKLIEILIIILVSSIGSSVFAKVNISPDFVFDGPELSFEVAPRNMELIPFPKGIAKPSDRYYFEINIENKIFKKFTALYCDAENLVFYQNKQPYKCQGIVEGKKHFSFEARPVSATQHYLVFDNRKNVVAKKKVTVSTKIKTVLEAEKLKNIEKTVKAFSESIHKIFEIPRFDVSIKPCGLANAFSETKGGHITLCTELFMKIARDGNVGALMGVLFHELGHTVLNLWDLPNWNNETTVDEFAAVMFILSNKEGLIHDWIKDFEKNIDLEMSVDIIKRGSRHPANAQRVAALRQVIKDKENVVKRWNKQLYPHLNDEFLLSIIGGEQEGRFNDIELAKATLKKRDIVTEGVE